MAQLVTSFDSIRQTLNNGQFDAAENLLRDLLVNPEISEDAHPFLIEVLASVVTRRALDHARNFVSRGNIEAARRILHKTWHQLENEGFDEFGEHSRAAISHVAGASEESNFSANSFGELIEHYLGNAHFESFIGELPRDPSQDSPVERATTIVKAAEIKPIQSRGTSVVVENAGASVGQAILKSMLRPRVLLVAFIVFMAVLAIGFFTRSETWKTEFLLLRPTSTTENSTNSKVHMLPKQTLQGLATQSEVLEAVSEGLRNQTSDENLRAFADVHNLKSVVSASVATGDYGATDSTIKIEFISPNEQFATTGGELLKESIITVHNDIVSRDLKKKIDLKKNRFKANKDHRVSLNTRLQKLTKDALIPAGDRYEMRNTYLRMLESARISYNDASRRAAGSSVRYKQISLSREELPKEVEWTVEEPEQVQLLLQPQYLHINSRKTLLMELTAEIRAGNLGPGHSKVIQQKELQAEISGLEKELRAKEEGAKNSIRQSKTKRNNASYDAMDVEARLSKANRERMAAEEAKALEHLDQIAKELRELDAGETGAADLATELVDLAKEQSQLRNDISRLEVFVAGAPGGLTVASDVSTPMMNKSSPVKIFLAAIGLALLAAIIASFTGGHRAVHMVVLGLIATLFHVR